MTTRPILFSGPMVRAILENKKTQTRRSVKPQPLPSCVSADYSENGWGTDKKKHHWLFADDAAFETVSMDCPYGKPGNQLWVRETWTSVGCEAWPNKERPIFYRADGEDLPSSDCKWKPSIHMPRWASRLTLEIVKVRVQRLQDISAFDALAEGCPYHHTTGFRPSDAINWYHSLWNSINGEGAWEANPWVWVVEFTRVSND